MLRSLLRSDIGAMIESLRTDMNLQFEGVQAQLDEVRGDYAKLDAKLERRTRTLADAIAAVDSKLDAKIEVRTKALEDKLDARTKSLEDKLDARTKSLEDKLDARTKSLADSIAAIDARLRPVESRRPRRPNRKG